MSKENTEFDVRLAIYDGSKHPIAHIRFFNDCEVLVDCERVAVKRDGNRLYFMPDISGMKFSGNNKDTLQVWKDFPKVRDLEGKYDLKFDTDKNRYYIDRSEKISDHEHKSVLKGIKHLNYKAGEREKRPMTVAITDKGKSVVEKQKKKDSNDVVIKALFALLREQVKDNVDALSTIEVLEKVI